MNDDDNLVEKIAKMYADEKSHKFIIHLIHTFIPIQTNATKIFDDTNKRCCITRKGIISVNQQMSMFFSLDKSTVIGSLLDMDKKKQITDEINQKRGNREGGYCAEGTDKVLCLSALQALHEFVLNRIMCGDFEINRIVSKKWKATF